MIRHRFRKVLVFTVHTETQKKAFSKNSALESVLESCVFGDRFDLISVDVRHFRKEKVAFSTKSTNDKRK